MPPDNIRRGDIVLFDRENGHYALHRVLSRNKDQFSMAGDHQWHIERDLPVGQVVGKVQAVVRNNSVLPVDLPLMRAYAAVMYFFAVPKG